MSRRKRIRRYVGTAGYTKREEDGDTVVVYLERIPVDVFATTLRKARWRLVQQLKRDWKDPEPFHIGDALSSIDIRWDQRWREEDDKK